MAKRVMCGKWISEDSPDGTGPIKETCKLEPHHNGRCVGHMVGRKATESYCERCFGWLAPNDKPQIQQCRCK